MIHFYKYCSNNLFKVNIKLLNALNNHKDLLILKNLHRTIKSTRIENDSLVFYLEEGEYKIHLLDICYKLEVDTIFVNSDSSFEISILNKISFSDNKDLLVQQSTIIDSINIPSNAKMFRINKTVSFKKFSKRFNVKPKITETYFDNFNHKIPEDDDLISISNVSKAIMPSEEREILKLLSSDKKKDNSLDIFFDLLKNRLLDKSTDSKSISSKKVKIK